MEKIYKNRNNKTNKIFFMMLSIIFIFFCTGLLSAENNESEGHYFWVNLGAGMSLGADPDGDICISPGIVMSYLAGTHLFSLRYAHSYEFNILGSSPANEVMDIGLLYGIIARNEIGFASISAGLGGVSGIKRVGDYMTGYMGKKFFTMGVPLEAQLFLDPFGFLGVGLYAFANVNLEKSFAGVLFCIQLGKVPRLEK